MPPRKTKKTSTATPKAAKKAVEAPTEVESVIDTGTTVEGDGVEKVGIEVPVGEIGVLEIEDSSSTAIPKAKASKPSAASQARRKRALIDELRDERTPLTRQLEIRSELDGDLAGVPILSHQELSRLGD